MKMQWLKSARFCRSQVPALCGLVVLACAPALFAADASPASTPESSGTMTFLQEWGGTIQIASGVLLVVAVAAFFLLRVFRGGQEKVV